MKEYNAQQRSAEGVSRKWHKHILKIDLKYYSIIKDYNAFALIDSSKTNTSESNQLL